jgi:membrane protein implicated in regulation of membrane protease activity
MLTLYLACLVFGGVLLAISLFTGGDADSAADQPLDAPALDAPAELTAGPALEVHADTAGHLPTDAAIDGDHPAVLSVQDGHGGGVAPTVHSAFEYFSFRNFVYSTTFFGLTGSALTWLAMPFTLTLVSSVGMGVFAGYVGHRFMRYLRGSESGESLHVASLLGHPATVVLPPTKERKGKVRITISGHRVEMLALLHADAAADDLRAGERVFIVAIDRDVAHVDRADFIDTV